MQLSPHHGLLRLNVIVPSVSLQMALLLTFVYFFKEPLIFTRVTVIQLA